MSLIDDRQKGDQATGLERDFYGETNFLKTYSKQLVNHWGDNFYLIYDISGKHYPMV